MCKTTPTKVKKKKKKRRVIIIKEETAAHGAEEEKKVRQNERQSETEDYRLCWFCNKVLNLTCWRLILSFVTNSLRVERKHTKLKLAHATLKVLPVASSRTTATRRFLLPSNLQPCKSVTAGGFASLSPMTAAYILLSDDRFLSTLTHCRPSDVVSVRSNNGFWWVSVSKASLWLLHRWVSEFPEVYHGGGGGYSDITRRESQLYF